MGTKGIFHRPKGVSEEEWARRYAAAFPTATPPAELCEVCNDAPQDPGHEMPYCADCRVAVFGPPRPPSPTEVGSGYV